MKSSSPAWKLLENLQEDIAVGFTEVGADLGGEELDALIQLVGRSLLRATGTSRCPWAGEAFLALGFEVGAPAHHHVDADKGLAVDIGGDEDRDAVLELGLEILGLGGLENQGLVGEFLGAGGDLLGEGEGWRQARGRGRFG